jgi:hypothetical protein
MFFKKIGFKTSLLLFIGIFNSLLFFSQNGLIFKTKKIPISPLPLIFDAPMGHQYWSYAHRIEYYTESRHRKFLSGYDLLNYYPRSFFAMSIYFVPMAGLLTDSNDVESNAFLKEILCYSSLKIYGEVKESEKILKVSINAEHKKTGEVVRYKEFLCD